MNGRKQIEKQCHYICPFISRKQMVKSSVLVQTMARCFLAGYWAGDQSHTVLTHRPVWGRCVHVRNQ